ncbi:unnamed protein product [Clavelina lepadiformis]|uniref:Uncharacterized protein n=1 Tax=Clavelina lepadiformis TaxID=159417 RepID=A0ABP0F9M5_CLALP
MRKFLLLRCDPPVGRTKKKTVFFYVHGDTTYYCVMRKILLLSCDPPVVLTKKITVTTFLPFFLFQSPCSKQTNSEIFCNFITLKKNIRHIIFSENVSFESRTSTNMVCSRSLHNRLILF